MIEASCSPGATCRTLKGDVGTGHRREDRAFHLIVVEAALRVSCVSEEAGPSRASVVEVSHVQPWSLGMLCVH